MAQSAGRSRAPAPSRPEIAKVLTALAFDRAHDRGLDQVIQAVLADIDIASPPTRSSGDFIDKSLLLATPFLILKVAVSSEKSVFCFASPAASVRP